jgi:DNA-binding transcriptional regulator YiaG
MILCNNHNSIVGITSMANSDFSTGTAVRVFRLKTGLNQQDFWSRIGVTQSGGSRYEAGRSMPKQVVHLLNLVYSKPKQADEYLARLRNGLTDHVIQTAAVT